MYRRIICGVVSIVLVFALVFSSTVVFASEALTANETDLSKTGERCPEFVNLIESIKEGPTKDNMTATLKISFAVIKNNIKGAITFNSIVAAVYKLINQTGLEITTTKAQLAAMLKKLCAPAKLISLVKTGSNAHGLKITFKGAKHVIVLDGVNVQKIKWAIKTISIY